MIYLFFITIFFQIANNFVINFINPYNAFFIIYFLATCVFILLNIKEKMYKLDHLKYTIPIILTGQILSPLFYFKGVFLTDIFTQSFVYSLYPFFIIIFSRWYDKKPIFTYRYSLIYLLFLSILSLLLIKIEINEGSVYLFISCCLLIIHKIIHKIAIAEVGRLNEYSITFYGLLGSALMGLMIIFFFSDIYDIFKFINFVNIETTSGILFLCSFFIIIIILSKIQLKRNEELNNNQFEDLYLYILLVPPFVTLLNNYLILINDKISLNFSIYGIEGLIYILLIIVITRSIKLLLFYLSMLFLFLSIFINQYPLFDINYLNTNEVKILYNNDNSYNLLKNTGGMWVSEKNKYDFNPYIITENKVKINYIREIQDKKNKVYNFYVKDYIATQDSSVVYDMKNYKKYILKELPVYFLKNMKSFVEYSKNKEYLIPFKIIETGNKSYVLTDFVDGLTFEDYYNQYDKDYISNINQVNFINNIIKIAEMNLELINNGWINRDTHQKNILFTNNGIKMIDYDLVFPLKEKNGIDSNGFTNNLYDILKLFYPKKDIIKEKFKYTELPYQLNFKDNKNIININLERINKYIQDNSYSYNKYCKDIEKTGLNNLIKDLKNLNAIETKSKLRLTQFNPECVNKATFFNEHGKISFIVYHLPSKYFDFNYVDIKNFNQNDLLLEVNKVIKETLPENTILKYSGTPNKENEINKIINYIKK